MSVRTLARRESLSIGLFDAILFGAWAESPPRADDVEVCIDAALKEAKTLGRVAIVVALHTRTPLPDERVRAVIQKQMQRLDPFLCCGATVISREGFAGSALRAVAATLQLLSRPTHPEKIVSTGAEAAAFVCSKLALERPSAPAPNVVTDVYTAFTREIWAKAAK
jgi:hypothetical protein